MSASAVAAPRSARRRSRDSRDRADEAGQDHQREHVGESVEQSDEGLGRVEVAALDDHDLGVHVAEVADESPYAPTLDPPGQLADERLEIEHDPIALGPQAGCLPLARQQELQLGVRGAVDVAPDLLELLTADEVEGHVVDQLVERGAEQGAEALHLGGKRPEVLVEIGEPGQLGRCPAGDGALDGGLVGQRADRRDVLAVVVDHAVHPPGEHRRRHEDAADDDQ